MNLKLFYIIFGLSSYPFFVKSSLFLSYILIYIVPVTLAIWAIFISKRKMFNFSLFFLTSVISWAVAALLKIAFHIPRPFTQEGIIPIVREYGFSFPSEHMAVFTAFAFATYFLNKKVGVVFFILALLIGLSRIILGVHYPSDILGGFCVGAIISFIIIRLFKKI